MNRRVVITGAGVVSPIGIGMAAFSQSLREGRTGDGPIQSFVAEPYPFKRACEVKAFDGRLLGTHLLDPFIQYAVKAADEALRDAQFNPADVDPYRIALSVSSSKGGMHTLDRFKERFEKRPSAILGARIYSNLVPNFAAQWIARRWKIRGPAKCYIAACATGINGHRQHFFHRGIALIEHACNRAACITINRQRQLRQIVGAN